MVWGVGWGGVCWQGRVFGVSEATVPRPASIGAPVSYFLRIDKTFAQLGKDEAL